MKKNLFVLAIVLMAIITLGSDTLAQDIEFAAGDVAVIKIGEKISNTGAGDKISIIPLYTIRIGDTTVAETENTLWQKIFGLYARNAIFYTREGNGNGWKATGYRRPITKEEVEKFVENPLYFYAEKIINVTELPASLGGLTNELSLISFVMEYLRGGIQIYPMDGSSIEEVVTLAKKIFFLTRPKADI